MSGLCSDGWAEERDEFFRSPRPGAGSRSDGVGGYRKIADIAADLGYTEHGNFTPLLFDGLVFLRANSANSVGRCETQGTPHKGNNFGVLRFPPDLPRLGSQLASGWHWLCQCTHCTRMQVTTGEASATQPETFFPDFPSDSLRESEGKSGSLGNAVFGSRSVVAPLGQAQRKRKRQEICLTSNTEIESRQMAGKQDFTEVMFERCLARQRPPDIKAARL